MAFLVAPVFNSITTEPVSIPINETFRLLSGNDQLYTLCYRSLRDYMNENKHFFEDRVSPESLYICAEYPDLKVTEDRELFEGIENKLNLSSSSGVCSIPYIIIIEGQKYGITYLKRSVKGKKFTFEGETRAIFEKLLSGEGSFPKLAYRRYLLSLEKGSPEDQLLDMWIALESLFVPDGKKGEITYKVRLRMAYFFTSDYQEREWLSEFIKASYNHRSEIVHSGKALGTELKEEVRILRRMARATLLNMYANQMTIQELKNRLDKAILSGKSYSELYPTDYFTKY
ncbi:hypothetical protein ACQCN2_14425 [Brevibacillus ginsengisoli]|uniref:hypothetical protein n=1 Tax=Brevibacillus ginsengisoli TaxID=363854 RepID=UPI003CF500D8